MADAEARDWLLDQSGRCRSSAYDMVDELRGWLDEMPADQIAFSRLGVRAELPFRPTGLTGKTLLPQGFAAVALLLPNQLFTRDSSCSTDPSR